MSENMLTKKILDEFFGALEKNGVFPRDLLEKLKAFRQENKIAKGVHLKNLFVTYNPNVEDGSNEVT